MKDQPNRHPAYFMNRRRFLKILGLSGITSFLAACQRRTPTETWSTEIWPAATRLLLPSIVPSVTPPAAASPTHTSTPSPKAMAAIGQVSFYDPALLRRELERMLSGIGGLSDLIKPGARVGIKANLTGGTWWDAKGKPPATEMFVTHPAVVGALGEMLLDMGAGHLAVMDGIGDEANFQKWGYIDMAKTLGAKLIDLCKPDQYVDFISFPVGSNAYIYDQFDLNATLGEFDVIISVAKMKCHSTTGVTLSLKNMIGLAPISLYRRNEDDNNRSAFHDTEAFDKRLPRVAIDLNRAIPVDFSVIDGVITAEGGAGPWNAEMAQIKPGLLVASADPVAADAVATALMGFDPAAKSGSAPFVNGENLLALAYDSKLGTNRLAEIGIAGPSIQEVALKFKPAV